MGWCINAHLDKINAPGRLDKINECNPIWMLYFWSYELLFRKSLLQTDKQTDGQTDRLTYGPWTLYSHVLSMSREWAIKVYVSKLGHRSGTTRHYPSNSCGYFTWLKFPKISWDHLPKFYEPCAKQMLQHNQQNQPTINHHFYFAVQDQHWCTSYQMCTGGPAII